MTFTLRLTKDPWTKLFVTAYWILGYWGDDRTAVLFETGLLVDPQKLKIEVDDSVEAPDNWSWKPKLEMSAAQ